MCDTEQADICWLYHTRDIKTHHVSILLRLSETKYGENCTLLFTDTDSFCCRIQTDDIYRDMAENADPFDTHPLYSKTNHPVLGKFKSETGSVAPREFVGLRAKMYSLDVPNDKNSLKYWPKEYRNPT